MSALDDSALYTGVDGEPTGVFGNEVIEDSTKEILHEQERKLKELTPKLEIILKLIEDERQTALEFVAGYVDESKDDDANYRAELKAAGRYRQYLNTLKTKFELQLREAKGGKS